jgi:hypothetical protein
LDLSDLEVDLLCAKYDITGKLTKPETNIEQQAEVSSPN